MISEFENHVRLLQTCQSPERHGFNPFYSKTSYLFCMYEVLEPSYSLLLQRISSTTMSSCTLNPTTISSPAKGIIQTNLTAQRQYIKQRQNIANAAICDLASSISAVVTLRKATNQSCKCSKQNIQHFLIVSRSQL